jgi:5-methylcytosine-specific restriction enzyme B
MIPKDIITKEHVLVALSEIDANGVPENREATGFDLVCNGKSYPPKYVISLATKQARGTELRPSEFYGGEPTTSVLRDLGFEIVARVYQSVRVGLEKVMERYVKARTSETFGKEHKLWDVFVELRRSLRLFDSVHDNQHVKVDSSIGQGNWNKVPWIALLDDRETNDPTPGRARTI